MSTFYRKIFVQKWLYLFFEHTLNAMFVRENYRAYSCMSAFLRIVRAMIDIAKRNYGSLDDSCDTNRYLKKKKSIKPCIVLSRIQISNKRLKNQPRECLHCYRM